MTDSPTLPSRSYRGPAPRVRRHFGRRLAILGLAIGVPAMAAPMEWGDDEPAVSAAITPMAFETPGESFPGSAFYYLDDQPFLPETAGGRPVDDAELALRAPAGRLGGSAIAAKLKFRGSAVDRMRAQQCLTMAIYYEAANEPDAGQRAVAQVVLNRVAHPSYPDTVCGVVFQGSERTTGCQFSFTCDGSLNRKPARQWWDRAASVAHAALAGAVYAPAGLATHYHTLQVHPYWADSLDNIGTIGAHTFYRWRGAAGAAAAFTDPYRGGEPLAAPHPRTFRAEPAPVDPVTLAQAYEAKVPASTIVASAPIVSQPEPSILPMSGQVRQEYAQSGQWLKQP